MKTGDRTPTGDIELVEQVYRYKGTLWRRNKRGWACLNFGWFPFGPNPRWEWRLLPDDRVPRDIREFARGEMR